MAEPAGPTPSREGGGSYEGAVSALLSPLHQASTPAALRAASTRRRNTLRDMRAYMRRCRMDGSAPSSPVVIHVAGTKGKGSTLALCESVLRRAYGMSTGMFTSPHLVTIRERIRVNGVPVSRQVFAEAYWTVRRRLDAHHDADSGGGEGAADGLPPLPALPGYFRMLTLMAFYTFRNHRRPAINAILIEVGMGGRYDATNAFDPRVLGGGGGQDPVRGVTLIDYDHTRVLGSTLGQIAWEKGGIFVRGKLENIGMDDGGYDLFLTKHEAEHCGTDANGGSQSNGAVVGACIEPETVFTSGKNTPEVLRVLRRIAESNGCYLRVVHDSELDPSASVGLRGDHQRSNAALAVAMCRHAIEGSHGQDRAQVSPERIRDALAEAFWPGRCHTLSIPRTKVSDRGLELSMNLRCDGAHTPASIEACVEWFRAASEASEPPSPNSAPHPDETRGALIFNCGHERNPIPLLHALRRSGLFGSAHFCRADSERPSAAARRIEWGWVREPLGETTLEGMFRDLESVRLLRGGEDVPSDPSELTASTWQGTLANVWRVLDAHARMGGGAAEPPPVKVAAGLTVKDALAMIQNETSSAVTEGIESISSVRKKRILIEVCATGSLYIVGSALEAVGWEEGEAPGELACPCG